MSAEKATLSQNCCFILRFLKFTQLLK